MRVLLSKLRAWAPRRGGYPALLTAVALAFALGVPAVSGAGVADVRGSIGVGFTKLFSIFLKPHPEQLIAQQAAERMDVRAASMELSIKSLSGGNQQRALLARWVSAAPSVAIFDEPTRGVDVGAKMAIYKIVRDLAASGVSVILVSSELEEVLGLSHRVLVMSGGRQRDVLDREHATAEAVMALAVPLTAAVA